MAAPTPSDTARPRVLRNPLIGPDDPPIYEVFNEDGPARVLLVADHGGNAMPGPLGNLGLDSVTRGLHIAYDIGIGPVTRRVAQILRAPAVIANYSRLIIDPNRILDHPTSIPEVSDHIPVPGNLALTPEQRELRVNTFFWPYHRAIAERLRRFQDHRVIPAFVSMHSFTPVMDGALRPWHVGVLWDKDDRIADPLMHRLAQGHSFEGAPLCIGDNQPYSGRDHYGFTVEYHAESAGIPHVLIELRQDLIAMPEGQETWAGIIGATLARILAYDGIYRIEAS